MESASAEAPARGAGRARDKGKRSRSCGRLFGPRVSVSKWARPGRGGWQAVVCRLGGTSSSLGVLGVGLSSEAGTRADAASLRPSGGGVTRKPHPGQLLRGTTFPFPLDLGRWPSTDAHPPAGELSEKLNLGHKLRGWGPREALRARPAAGGAHPPGRWFPFWFGQQPKDSRSGLE